MGMKSLVVQDYHSFFLDTYRIATSLTVSPDDLDEMYFALDPGHVQRPITDWVSGAKSADAGQRSIGTATLVGFARAPSSPGPRVSPTPTPYHP
jgi:hypothetical protein